MGSDDIDGWPEDGEGPARKVWAAGFWIDACCVSNADFSRFVVATGYRTQAEVMGSSCVFHLALHDQARAAGNWQSIDGSWWLAVQGAQWRTPEGVGSNLEGRWDHPAVHISHDDAQAYAAWAGKGLPDESQWEKAARGGLYGKRFPWGDDLHQGGAHHCNIWQGDFPLHNTGADGWLTTSPVNAFQPNGLGLYNCSGNVWEWCADTWATRTQAASPVLGGISERSSANDLRVIKGGSYLCHASYCNRYRVAARSCAAVHMSSAHLGFRCVTPAE